MNDIKKPLLDYSQSFSHQTQKNHPEDDRKNRGPKNPEDGSRNQVPKNPEDGRENQFQNNHGDDGGGRNQHQNNPRNAGRNHQDPNCPRNGGGRNHQGPNNYGDGGGGNQQHPEDSGDGGRRRTTRFGEPSNPSFYRQPSFLHRSKTAPALSAVEDLLDPHEPPKLQSSPRRVVRQALVVLLLYLFFGTLFYHCFRRDFSLVETHPIIDALYFCVVTLCTIGYGDIIPASASTKIFSCVIVLFGFGLVESLLGSLVNHILATQENKILAGIQAGSGHIGAGSFIVDPEKGRMRIRTKVGFALGAVVFLIGLGTLFLFFWERLNWIDSIYLSVMSVTTVGYGDKAFKTGVGRLFATFWLLISTLAVAHAFLYLAETRTNKRDRRFAKWVLDKNMTVEDLLAADVNNNGFISKSEFVLFKLKEMGKVGERDILQICAQFKKLDPNNRGKLTLLHLWESRR